jgi:hypothetical protein
MFAAASVNSPVVTLVHTSDQAAYSRRGLATQARLEGRRTLRATTNGSSKLSALRVWPWSARVAVLLVPVILLTLVVAHGVVRAVLDWPDRRYGGWVLLGIVLLSLMPVLLLLIELLATAGGSVQLPGGVAFSFSGASLAVAATVRSTTLAENLG